MDGARQLGNKHLLDWDETDVHHWLSNLGFPQYEREIRENNIQGDTLCLLDSDGLKSLGIVTVGQRLSILKSIYHLKMAHDIPLNEDDYVPPSETLASAPTENVSLENIHSSVKATRLRSLEESSRTLNLAMRSFMDELIKLRSSMGLPDGSLTEIRKRLPNLRSEVKEVDRPTAMSERDQKAVKSLPTPSTSQDSSDIDSTKVTLDDPTWKVLPAALRKHRINTDEWQNYAMFISYGAEGNRKKRRLEPEEKPLYLFKKLKEARKSPAFVLKNMKDLRSPLSLDSDSSSAISQTSFTSNHGQNSSIPPSQV
ncbi:hypothetical protein GALMADRAFT_1092083 [Galerina marginata CBS 339.88]|uniref:Uncharacterized protein n=1 Tax=Galerina marginata (strain CBS 339.88) TaxID=685588 RepID=A0A067TBR4_GALM3|nr:hypothetical protein GALMADRAFT_1092083 [Galerina marginata CBS 339.88]